MLELDLECTELAGKLALEEENASESSDESNEESDEEEEEETSDEESEEEKEQQSVKKKLEETNGEDELLISKGLSLLNIDSKLKQKPKIIELN